MTGAVLALALVAVNLVHLLLTRGVARAGEIATRAALGASRWRLSRLFLVESLIYGAVGVAGGLALARWLTVSLSANIPTRGTESGTPALVSMTFDGRVVMFAVVTGLLVAILGGLGPAWRLGRARLAAPAHAPAGGGARVSARLSRTMLASEVAVSTVVLTGAVFAGIGIWRFLNQPTGVDLAGRFNVSFPAVAGATNESVDWPAVREAVRRMDGVRAASAAFQSSRTSVRVGERVLDRDEAGVMALEAGGLSALGLHLVAGRAPDRREWTAAAPVAVVDTRFAATYWPSLDAIGQRLAVGDVVHQVVGVIEHPRFSLVRETPPILIVPAGANPEREGMTVWAPTVSEAVLADRVAAVLASAAPGFRPNVSARTFDRTFGDDIANVRFQRPIVIVLGLFAFSVAGIGLFGLVAYLVEQRTRDFGVRLALGARPGDIWRELARHSLTPAAVGLVAGLAGALALSRVMRAGMFGWESSAPLSMAAVAALTLVAALLAVVVPARRVLRIDPAIILRAD